MATFTPSLSAITTFTLGNISYYVRRRNEFFMGPDSFVSSDIKPAVVIHTGDSSTISPLTIDDTPQRFEQNDDVSSPEFESHGSIILLYENCLPSVDQNLNSGSKYGSKLVLRQIDHSSDLPEGPDFIRDDYLHQAWRLYPDDLGAFISTISPDQDTADTLQPLPTLTGERGNIIVAVPSRLYLPSGGNLLHGMRIAVKDNMHISGMVTTHGCRSYASCYGTQNETSALVKAAISHGAVLVGKTKLSSFAGNETPPNGPIDYLAPFNPRGDGYQNPSGSSMGPGAAIAGYPWLDCAIATDTTGSTRAPAACNGVWGIRTAWDSLPMMGIIPSAQDFDTVGLLARNADVLSHFLNATQTSAGIDPEKTPAKLLYPTDWLPKKNDGHQRIIEALTQQLERALNLNRTEVSLAAEWPKTAPEHLRTTSLADYLRKTGYNINMYDGYHNFAEFRELHQS